VTFFVLVFQLFVLAVVTGMWLGVAIAHALEEDADSADF
jgi:hypothetical protein